ncbi:MAG: hypothetical protein IJT33_03235 [Campylobacter sp.]|nr:hypothetical protein [Campylobacter sp.]MBQ9876118.1 hypothetical protein [Campylobacter sp.]
MTNFSKFKFRSYRLYTIRIYLNLRFCKFVIYLLLCYASLRKKPATHFVRVIASLVLAIASFFLTKNSQ